MMNCLEVFLSNDGPVVKLLVEALKHGSGERIAEVDLPKPGRSSPVAQMIIVVVGPYAVTGRTQNVAADYVETEAQDNVEIVPANRLHIRRREILREPPAKFGQTRQLRDMS
jgi:hypothetical protein